ncbi:GTP-binding protein [Brucella sp. BE17]|uniref:CobW family GTP-binding protein n=1 Tax=Brucella sp. BE17 TaxID=3142977 RepID=UPI0031BAB083
MPVPVTILSGFLGSGKTTLINHLLKANGNQPIAIIENEYGEANIDSMLLDRDDTVSVVEMTNGCVCCSVRGEFAVALNELMAKRTAGDLKFERILIETTGLADPSPVVQTFFVDDDLRDATQLDGCITLVDCEHIEQQLSEHAVAAAQIAFADRILLTKSDRCDAQTHARVLARIHEINRKAEIFDVVNGQCPPSLWLDIHAFELSDTLSLNEGFTEIRSGVAPRFRQFGAAQPVMARPHDDRIQSYYLEAERLDLDRIGAFMEGLIETYGNDMLRYKGVLAIVGRNERLVVQGVHKVVAFDYGSPWREDEQASSKLVIIGRDLPVDEIRAGFSAATA